jgi:hypothetical protein
VFIVCFSSCHFSLDLSKEETLVLILFVEVYILMTFRDLYTTFMKKVV